MDSRLRSESAISLAEEVVVVVELGPQLLHRQQRLDRSPGVACRELEFGVLIAQQQRRSTQDSFRFRQHAV